PGLVPQSVVQARSESSVTVTRVHGNILRSVPIGREIAGRHNIGYAIAIDVHYPHKGGLGPGWQVGSWPKAASAVTQQNRNRAWKVASAAVGVCDNQVELA